MTRRHLLDARPFSEPHAPIVRFKTGRVNLSKTLTGMAERQSLLLRLDRCWGIVAIKSAAARGKVRVRVVETPGEWGVMLTVLGPCRPRKVTCARPDGPRRERCFKGWRSLAQNQIDIFS